MKQLGQSAITTGSGTLLYTVPTGFRTQIQDMIIANTGAVPIDIKVHLVPSGGAAGTGNLVVPNVEIPANTWVHWSGNQTMTAGAFIQAIGSATGVTITISGTEERVST